MMRRLLTVDAFYLALFAGMLAFVYYALVTA